MSPILLRGGDSHTWRKAHIRQICVHKVTQTGSELLCITLCILVVNKSNNNYSKELFFYIKDAQVVLTWTKDNTNTNKQHFYTFLNNFPYCSHMRESRHSGPNETTNILSFSGLSLSDSPFILQSPFPSLATLSWLCSPQSVPSEPWHALKRRPVVTSCRLSTHSHFYTDTQHRNHVHVSEHTLNHTHEVHTKLFCFPSSQTCSLVELDKNRLAAGCLPADFHAGKRQRG